MVTLNHRQPDDPGVPANDNPIVFGEVFQELTPHTLQLIKMNAGKLPAINIARALCWNVKRLQRIADAHGIDLYYRAPSEIEPRGA